MLMDDPGCFSQNVILIMAFVARLFCHVFMISNAFHQYLLCISVFDPMLTWRRVLRTPPSTRGSAPSLLLVHIIKAGVIGRFVGPYKCRIVFDF